MGLSDNVSYTYNPDAQRGEKITNITIDGKAMEMDKEYRVAASSFLFDGGDSFIDPGKVTNRNTVGYNDLEAFVDYLKTGEAKVRAGQKDVGVVLPEGGLKAGQANTITLSSLSYSSEGEPQAKTVTVKVGKTEVTAEVDNSVTEADKGLGEQGRATVTIDLPAETYKDEPLVITTDAGTEITVPQNIVDGVERPAAPEQPEGSSLGAGPIVGILVGVLSLLALAFAFPIHQILGPLAYLG